MTADLTTKQLPQACAMLEQECPGCGGSGATNAVQPYGYEPNTCYCAYEFGTPGRIPLLEGVRGKCKECENGQVFWTWLEGKLAGSYVDEKVGRWRDCGYCHGLGYTPTEDAWKWWDESKPYIGALNSDGGAVIPIYIPPEGKAEDAFFSALYQALRPLACNAEEVENWVGEHMRSTLEEVRP